MMRDLSIRHASTLELIGGTLLPTIRDMWSVQAWTDVCRHLNGARDGLLIAQMLHRLDDSKLLRQIDGEIETLRAVATAHRDAR